MFIKLTPTGTDGRGHTAYEVQVPTELVACVREFELLVLEMEDPRALMAAIRQVRAQLSPTVTKL